MRKILRQIIFTDELRNTNPRLNCSPKAVLDHKELENFAIQIAEGMAHLEKIGIVHRYLI